VAMSTILAIDQGTSGTTVILFDANGRILDRAYREVRQYYPESGWVEHDAQDILIGVIEAASEVLRRTGLVPDAIGITNQRETVVVWDKSTGNPLHKAIVWQCRRTARDCDLLRAQGKEPTIRAKTGLVLDPYFSATKIAWLLREEPELALLAERGELLVGTIDSWLAWNLTGNHVTDCSNAARTMLLNIHTLSWDPDLLRMFAIPAQILPKVVDTAGICGYTKQLDAIPAGIPVAALVGDQQAALFGQACFDRGMAKCTYGTGAFLLLNTGEKPVFSNKGLLTTVAWRINGKTVYCLEGSVFVAGAAVQWLRDGLGIIASAGETAALAASVQDTGGVKFVPAFVGLGTPYWDASARGLIGGITRGTTRAHIVRACLEAIAQQSQDVLECMAQDAVPPRLLRVDGGAAANPVLLQMQADLSGIEVHRPMITETTALGAAMLAGMGVKVWRDLAELQAVWQCDTVVEPSWDGQQRAAAREQWRKAVDRARHWF
jgi:glycerol kinase